MKAQRSGPAPRQSSSSKTGLLTAVLMLSTLAISACGDPPPPPMPSEFEFSVEAFVYDQNDTPVARVPVLIDGQIVGYTDKDGAFAAKILEVPNKQIELSLGDLTGYRFTSDNMIRETLVIRQGVGGAPVGLPISLRSSLHSLKNSYLAWVELKCDKSLKEGSCANIPLKLDGKTIATTNDEGKAHFAFEGIMGQKSLLTVDTPTYQKDSDYYVVFEPQQPGFELNLGIDSTVFVIEESFTDLIGLHAERVAEKPKPRTNTRRRTTTQKAAPKATTAKKAPAKKAPAKKPEPKNAVIDLW